MDITKWDAGTWIAVAAAAIALFAAWASWRQAKAAKDQVAIMRQQLRYETDDRHEAAGPIFDIRESAEGAGPTGKPAAGILVEQMGGPPLSEVTVTVQRNGGVRGLFEEDSKKIVDSVIWKDNAPGAMRQLIASLNIRGRRPFNIVLNFRCVEAVTGVTWNRTITTTPSIPFTTRKFGYRPASSADEDW